MPGDTYLLWTERGLSCRVARTASGWEVTVETRDGPSFVRRFAHSQENVDTQAALLRALLDRSPCRPETLTAVLKLLAQRPKPPRRRAVKHAARLTRASCPQCGTIGALVDATGACHCQYCATQPQDGALS